MIIYQTLNPQTDKIIILEGVEELFQEISIIINSKDQT
jgi:hypothetical protein